MTVITEHELRTALDRLSQRVTGGVDLVHLERRIRRRNRVRWVGAATGAVAVTAAIAIAIPQVMSPNSGHETTPSDVGSGRPAPTTSSAPAGTPEVPVTEPMPEYWQGSRLVEQRAYHYDKVTEGREQTIQLTYRPNAAGIGFAIRCDADPRVAYSIELNGADLLAFDNCSRRQPVERTLWGHGSLEAGKPSVMRITLRYDADASPDTKTADYDVATAPKSLLGTGPGELGIGFYMPVPWEDYQFPPEPEALAPFSERGIAGPVLYRFESTGLPEVNGSFQATVRSSKGFCVFGSLVGPGIVTVYANGRLVDGAKTWDWTGGDENGFGGPADAAPPSATFEVVAEQFTAPAWKVTIYECPYDTGNH